MRAFLAVDIDEATRTAIGELVARLKPEIPDVAWTRPENLHVTLRFFGDVADIFAEKFVHRFANHTAQAPPAVVRIEGLGAFPSLRRPSILWAGMSAGADELSRLQSAAEATARELGIEPDTRAFTPHLTIGRARPRSRHGTVREVFERERSFFAGAFVADAVSLFSSELTQHGARHTRLHRFTLDGIRSEGGV